ncbi:MULTISPECIES: recombinase family protein [Streptosporangium]|uniref:DNA invertase Pin-like site-specific DNA recombinase n=1 Tax=Streptosporangium brasiliense TaxID=47480 RepID=A0ABT9R3X1_9ACTN|nr:recombinase family protein [Streptosporangium brasiliense]MDP9863926.1 DNA invertase Pin-like site-specific DNA recombinase [Streptosporangium brasiliense]
MSKRAAILARISDADDGETAGVDDQVKDMRAFVARRGWSLSEDHVLVENDTSAFKRRKIKLPNGQSELRTVRPEFRRGLDLLATRQVDVLVVLDLDRLARQPRDLEDLIDLVEASKFAVTCESLTGSCQLTSDAGITMARIMCAVANKSSKDTARRVSRARQRQAEEGRFGGGRRPYGFEADGETPIPAEIAVIRRMADVVLLPAFGTPKGPTLAGIAGDLRAEGIMAADGGPWIAPTVRDVLLRPRNAALMVYKPGEGRKTYTPEDVIGVAPWEAIVTPEEHWVITGKLTDPHRRTNPGVAPHHLLSGIAACPCGAVVRVSGSSGKKDRPVYACQGGSNRAPGPHATAPKADLDDFVEALAVVILARDAADLIKPSQGTTDVGKIRAELAVIRERKAQLGEDRDLGIVERPEYLRRAKKLQARIEELERRFAEATQSATDPLAPFAGVESEEEALKVWKSLGHTQRREVIKSIMAVTLQPIGRGRRVPITDRVRIDPVKPSSPR